MHRSLGRIFRCSSFALTCLSMKLYSGICCPGEAAAVAHDRHAGRGVVALVADEHRRLAAADAR